MLMNLLKRKIKPAAKLPAALTLALPAQQLPAPIQGLDYGAQKKMLAGADVTARLQFV